MSRPKNPNTPTNAERKRLWMLDNPERAKYHWRKSNFKRYGMTNPDYDRMFAEQSGRCAICQRADEATLSVDHDHVTKRVRALLCKRCNLGLGLFGDSTQLVQQAAEYLMRHDGND